MVQFLKLDVIEVKTCYNELFEKELYMSLMSLQTINLQANDGLTKDAFYFFGMI